MPFEREDLGACSRVPHLRRLVPARGHDPRPVRAERRRQDVCGGSLESRAGQEWPRRWRQRHSQPRRSSPGPSIPMVPWIASDSSCSSPDRWARPAHRPSVVEPLELLLPPLGLGTRPLSPIRACPPRPGRTPSPAPTRPFPVPLPRRRVHEPRPAARVPRHATATRPPPRPPSRSCQSARQRVSGHASVGFAPSPLRQSLDSPGRGRSPARRPPNIPGHPPVRRPWDSDRPGQILQALGADHVLGQRGIMAFRSGRRFRWTATHGVESLDHVLAAERSLAREQGVEVFRRDRRYRSPW